MCTVLEKSKETVLEFYKGTAKVLLITRQTTELRNAIENNMSTDIKLSKVQMSKIIQSGGFLGKLLGPLLKT